MGFPDFDDDLRASVAKLREAAEHAADDAHTVAVPIHDLMAVLEDAWFPERGETLVSVEDINGDPEVSVMNHLWTVVSQERWMEHRDRLRVVRWLTERVEAEVTGDGQ